MMLGLNLGSSYLKNMGQTQPFCFCPFLNITTTIVIQLTVNRKRIGIRTRDRKREGADESAKLGPCYFMVDRL